MAQHNIEGEIENISENQLAFIKSVIEKIGFKNNKVTIETVGGAADNFGANVKRIILSGETENLTIFAKIAPTIDFVRKTSNVPQAFRNEHLMYTEVLPKLLQLQKQANVPEEDQIKFPTCYGTYLEAPNEVILIEDLKISGFTMMDRLLPLSDECVTSILKKLAIFHSLSYVLKSKEPETYNYYRDNLKDVMGSMDEGAFGELNFFAHVENLALGLLENPEHQNILRKVNVSEGLRYGVEMAKLMHGNPYAVILHGDCWTNNFMFKFEGETLKQSMLIDYQLSKNFSPVYDLFYLFFNCTDHESRVRCFYDWLDYYHFELDKSLSNYGLKISDVYPRDQLDADLKRCSKLGFAFSVLISALLTMKPEEAARAKDAIENERTDEMIKMVGDMHDDTMSLLQKRVIGLVESFTKFDLL